MADRTCKRCRGRGVVYTNNPWCCYARCPACKGYGGDRG